MVDKSLPFARESELDANSTRYEIGLAAPCDEELVRYWYSWSAIALASGIFILTIFLSLIMASPKVRRQSFNLYLLYLMIPDFSFSLLCGITCLMNAIHGSYWSHWMCNFQQWYCVWGIGSNCWINAIITWELHKLLKCCQQTKRYTIPPPQRVTCQALTVYLCCAFLGTWGLFEREHFPYHALQSSGLACIPVETDQASSLFFWLVFFPIYSGIPVVYVIYVTVDIWRRRLLPPAGKRRLLALYFGRIVVVFLVMWGPFFLLNFVFALWMPTWVMFFGGIFSHLQGPASAGVSLLKPDIYVAVQDLLHCKCCCFHSPALCDKDQEEVREEFQDVGRSARHVSLSVPPDETSVSTTISCWDRWSEVLQRLTARLCGTSTTRSSDEEFAFSSSMTHISDAMDSGVWPEDDGSYPSEVTHDQQQQDGAVENAPAATTISNTSDQGTMVSRS